MNGIKNSPLHRFAKPSSAGRKVPSDASYNPFDSDDESDKKPPTQVSSTKQNSGASKNLPNSSMTNPFDDDIDDREKEVSSSTSKFSFTYAQRNKYKNDFYDSGGVDNQNVEELENYSVYKSEETTKTVDNCLKIAEGIRDDATKTLVTLHQQGEQIRRTHDEAVHIDYDLSRGEKLLGSLGGLFSRTWKPKKTAPVKGPVVLRDDPVWSKGSHLEQRERLGLTSASNGRSKSRTPPPEPTNALQKVEVEKMKQDDGLSDLSDLLGELKVMAQDMGSEIERHNSSLNGLDYDVEILNDRVRGATQRGRRLLGK
ncbi:SNAP25 homologous protein SNAP33-like [Chenopodium quinoa]|uniref:t-SNARE coiled-coil homology domain-containing protein n=1 Tax=Chenopodium quinoa TaxID=63459 RepID=A0A803L9F7_CHEQI|nr:SNAP25 homologous protein SNAP33-like [Chenopodium quinoa]